MISSRYHCSRIISDYNRRHNV